MQDWLTFIIVILILGVVLDGLRRMRAHRRESIRVSRSMVVDDDGYSDDEDLSSSEFPGGGPRVVGVRDSNDLANVNEHLRQNYVASKMTRGAPKRQHADNASTQRTPVPMLMDSVEDNTNAAKAEREPALGSLDNLDDDVPPSSQTPVAEPQSVDEEDFIQSTPYQPVGGEPTPEHDSDDDAVTDTAGEPQAQTARSKRPAEQAAPKPEPQENAKTTQKTNSAPRAAPDEVLVIHVMARRGEMFFGPDLLDAMLAQGLRFGDMDIFHRYESSDGSGKILFSVANMVVPGTFAIEAMDEFESPGISMFLSLPIESDSLAAYNLMAESAQNIAQLLGGELKDENRSVMTRQTIEHGRQRVLEYERKRRLAKV